MGTRALVLAVLLVLAGCSSLSGTHTVARPGYVIAEPLDADGVPENATVVDAATIEPSSNGLDELLAEAVERDQRASRELPRSEMAEVEDQLSAAPRHDDSHYLRYEGEILRVHTKYLQ
ncbi:hypothetical protein [Halolamina salifodinae]|uniref:Uncharacterized protein YceK n=1 Tax=Halolamina salifodinae TaxID=1202767 RepID=A0A8T4GTJ0_9EURY|nr:hypothetical protein [Halolamina salifodinae]MBP1986327.1 uncharacterized protein YceK [Halolamina salifodinae]